MKCLTSRWSLVLATCLVAGCLNLGPSENPNRFYLLGGAGADGAWAEGVRTEGLGTGLSLGLRQLRLASYLETPTIVVRQGPHVIRFAEFDRWGENLDRGISRALAGYLASQPAAGFVDTVPWPRWTTHDYTIGLQVLRFEGVVPETLDSESLEGQAHLLATWEIVAPGGGEVLARGVTEVLEDGWAVGDYGELAAMLDTALQVLAAELAERLETLPTP